jgi:hypothetical protein
MATIPRPSRTPRLVSHARISLRVFAAVLCLFATQLSASQGTPRPDKPYALIFGTVWGPDDRPLYGVKVKIRRADQKKARWELFSDRRGEFAQRLPPGPADYLIWADLKGFKSPTGKELHQAEEVKVHIENDERQDTGLHLKE